MLKNSVKLMTTTWPRPSLLWHIVCGSRKVAEECRLPLEPEKEERGPEICQMAGVIFDDSLELDIHWKSRQEKL